MLAALPIFLVKFPWYWNNYFILWHWNRDFKKISTPFISMLLLPVSVKISFHMGLLLDLFISHCLYTNGSKSLCFPPLFTCARPETCHRLWKLVLMLSRDGVYVVFRKMLINMPPGQNMFLSWCFSGTKWNCSEAQCLLWCRDLPHLASQPFRHKYLSALISLHFYLYKTHRSESEQISICQLWEDLNSSWYLTTIFFLQV